MATPHRLDIAAACAANAAFWLITLLERIQNDMFDLGADLATPADSPGEALRILPGQVERLEAEIDSLNEQLRPLTSFILPGGSRAAANCVEPRMSATRTAMTCSCGIACCWRRCRNACCASSGTSGSTAISLTGRS